MKSFLTRLSVLLVLAFAVVGYAQAQTVTVTLTAPTNGASFAVNTPINLTATGTGTFGRIRFKQNGTNVSFGDTSAPYTDTFTPTSAGSYVLLAEAMTGSTVLATSTSVTVSVTGGSNAPPTVSLTSPSTGASQAAPATFTLTASAADSDGTIANVKFYDGATLLNTDSASPFTYGYGTSVIVSHSLTAVATDNLGASRTSTAVNVTVTSSSTVTFTRSYVYDANERLCKTIDPEAGATVMDYDAAGNIAWTATGTNLTSNTCDRASVTAGMKTIRTYDAMNRLTGVATPGGAADVTTTYAPDGLIASLAAANGPAGANPVTTTYSYNKRRLLTQETSSQAGYVYTLGYAYDANGFLASLTYPDTQVVTYSPDALGRATLVKAGTQTYASAITYFPNGAISGFTYGNGAVHTMTQNARFLPTRSRDVKGTTVILDDTYTFDKNGNVTDITDQAQAGLTTRGMAYDGLDRMTAAVSPQQWGNATYSYDAIDNLKVADQGARQYRYNYDANNRLSEVKTPAGASVWTFGYDANGNVTNKGAQDFTFDPSNRMMTAELTGSSSVQTYRYDGTGRRVQTTDPGAPGPTTFWVYGQNGQVMYSTEARRSQNLSYLYLGNTQVATRAVAFTTGTVTISYQHTDALGSIVAESNLVTKRNSYAPYGEAYAPTVVDGTGYTGHVMDQGTGLTYMQQRYYDPQIGRFLSVDPMASDTTTGWNFNRYNYAANSPYKFKDPDGRIIDTIADVVFIVADVAEISSQGLTATNGIALVADVIGAAVPGATGLGAGVRGISHAMDAVKVTAKELRASGRADYTASRAKALTENGGNCNYCPSPSTQGDHVKSLKATAGEVNAGTISRADAVKQAHSPDNVVGACASCNGAGQKGAKELSATPGEGKWVPSQPSERIKEKL